LQLPRELIDRRAGFGGRYNSECRIIVVDAPGELRNLLPQSSNRRFTFGLDIAHRANDSGGAKRNAVRNSDGFGNPVGVGDQRVTRQKAHCALLVDRTIDNSKQRTRCPKMHVGRTPPEDHAAFDARGRVTENAQRQVDRGHEHRGKRRRRRP
jgi:hypothetical protein